MIRSKPPGLVLASVACGLMCGVLFGCAHRGCSTARLRSEVEKAGGPPPPSSSPRIVLEKTGGIAGFRLALTVEPDGSWIARDLAHGKDKSGAFPPATMDSLRQLIAALPDTAWGDFPSSVVDDFQYHVAVKSGGSTREMRGGGLALPAPWHEVLAILERPWPELFQME